MHCLLNTAAPTSGGVVTEICIALAMIFLFFTLSVTFIKKHFLYKKQDLINVFMCLNLDGGRSQLGHAHVLLTLATSDYISSSSRAIIMEFYRECEATSHRVACWEGASILRGSPSTDTEMNTDTCTFCLVFAFILNIHILHGIVCRQETLFYFTA